MFILHVCVCLSVYVCVCAGLIARVRPFLRVCARARQHSLLAYVQLVYFNNIYSI